MASLLALDCSKHVGWALFKGPAAMPKCDTWKARDSWLTDDYGPYFSAFEKWLLGMMEVHQPEMLAFESPVLMQRDGRGTDEQNIRRLVGVVSIAEKVAYDRHIRCDEVNNQTAKSMFGVPGRRPEGMSKGQYKDLLMIEMINRGFPCGDNHQGDAAALGLVVYDSLEAA